MWALIILSVEGLCFSLLLILSRLWLRVLFLLLRVLFVLVLILRLRVCPLVMRVRVVSLSRWPFLRMIRVLSVLRL